MPKDCLMTIVHGTTRELKELAVIDGDPKAKTIILRWPMCGDLLFNVETGRARSLRHNMWSLTYEAKVAAEQYLKDRKEETKRMIASSGRE